MLKFLLKLLKPQTSQLQEREEEAPENETMETPYGNLPIPEISEWDFKPKFYPAIVAMLQQYTSAGSKITVSWDAGGDDCPIHCLVDGKHVQSEIDQRLFSVLKYKIIGELNLPSAGECYNRGVGTLSVKENKIYLQTSYVHYRNYYRDDYIYDDEVEVENTSEEDLHLNFKLPDPYQWDKLLKRAELTINASLFRNGAFNCSMYFRIRNGDDYQITSEQEDFYHKVIKAELEKHAEEFSKSQDGHPLYILKLWADITGSLLVDTILTRGYVELIEEAVEKEIVI